MELQAIRAQQQAQQRQAQQQSQQRQAFNRRGDRHPQTGVTGMIYPDDSVAVEGPQTWADRLRVGAMPRPPVAGDRRQNVYAPGGYDPIHKCPGYLHGQVFTCPKRKQIEVRDLWAIGVEETASSYLYSLIDLESGDTRSLTSAPKTIRPCLPAPPAPPGDPPPPVDPDAPWYLHIWRSANFGPLPAQACTVLPPIHPNNDSNPSLTYIAAIDSGQRVWKAFYRNGSAASAPWFSNTLHTYTQSSSPPPLPTGNLPIIETPFASSWDGSYIDFGAAQWTYVSGGCPTSPTGPPDRSDPRDPGGTPIPNTINVTLSLQPDGAPIAMIRHSPRCTFGGWEFEKSWRLEGDQLKPYSGRLSTDWRYQAQSFVCQSTIATKPFANVDAEEFNRYWEVDATTLPAGALTPNTSALITLIEWEINPADCNAPQETARTEEIEIVQRGGNPVILGAIAARITTEDN